MSLDVYIESYCDKCKKSEEHGSFNYTYNLGSLWRAALKEVHGLDISLGEILDDLGKTATAGDMVPVLRSMVEWMDRQDLGKYDAPNGWGTGRGGADFVRDVLRCCQKYPAARVRVCR